ncbi:hypothetical protein CLV70_12849, partial [Pseudosporangium ferrugineum]
QRHAADPHPLTRDKTVKPKRTGGDQIPLTNRGWQGERGFAILVGRWKALRRTTISPRRIGDVVAAALHLTHFEYKHLTGSC